MKEIIEKIDASIVLGRLAEARKLLLAAGKAGHPAKDRAAYAKLARRLDLPMLALRILHPAISTSPSEQPPAVRLEYAAALSLVGAYKEAERFFDSVDENQINEVLLLRAFHRIAQWDYLAATPLLEKYAALSTLTAYQKLIADTNLVVAWIYEGRKEAGPFVASLIERARAGKFLRLFDALLLQKAQWEIRQREWDDAFQTLALANKQTVDHQSVDQLLIQKWILFATLGAHPNRLAVTLQELAQLKHRARELKEWETVRSCDFQQAIETKDTTLAQRILFGTPHASLRDRLIREFGAPLSIEKEYVHKATEEEISLCSVLIEGVPNSPLEWGHLSHRTLLALSQDFYRPRKIAELHSDLFPNTVFNPNSSPLRVRKLIQRLRQGLVEHHIPLRIDSDHTMISLLPQAQVALRVPWQRKIFSPIQRITETQSEFSLKEASQALSLPLHRTARLVQKATQEKLLQKVGHSRATKYRFAG